MPAGQFSIYGVSPNMISGGVGVVGPLTITGSTASFIVGQVIDLILASSDNTVTPSTAATAAVIVPNAGIAATLLLKTSVGSVGLPISNANPTLISFSTLLQSSFVITAATSSGVGVGSAVEIRVI